MLRVSNLRKEYDRVVAVDEVSFDVKRGELFGLLGPNGAGKTTTIRTVLNIIQPDSGEITFDGKPFSPEMWNIIGYLPEERGLYRKSRILNTILYFASLKGMSAANAKPSARQWLDRFGLRDAESRKVEELSKGNQQKVQLIIALLHKPQLLILDEPFNGLDPVNQILLKDILLDLRQQNIAIIFSTHQMDQVEKMCDNICLINKGKVVLSGAISAIKKRYGSNSIRLEYDGDGTFLKTIPFVKRADVYQNYAEVELTDMNKRHELLGTMEGKLELRKFEVVEPSLNSIFVSVVGIPDQPREDDAAVSIQRPATSSPFDRKMLTAILTPVVTFILSVVTFINEFLKTDPQWLIPGALFLAAVLSLLKVIKQRKSGVKATAMNTSGEIQ